MTLSRKLTQELVKELFDYHEDGYLIWKVDSAKRVKAGHNAGHLNKSAEYVVVSIKRRKYLAHRLIFLWHYGYLPELLDHIDRDKTNNRIENIRPATNSQNRLNSCGRKGSSNYKGVSWNKRNEVWQVAIRFNGKTKHVGQFDCEIQAAKAYDQAARSYHDMEYAYLNFPETNPQPLTGGSE